MIAPAGASIIVDGAPLPASELEPVGDGSFLVARHALSKTDFHSASGDMPFGIVTYGYGDFTSYMVPGGLDLASITAPPPR